MKAYIVTLTLLLSSMAYSFSVSKLNDVLPFYTYQTLTDYDELKNEAESEVFDTWLNNLPKVLLWKLKYLASKFTRGKDIHLENCGIMVFSPIQTEIILLKNQKMPLQLRKTTKGPTTIDTGEEAVSISANFVTFLHTFVIFSNLTLRFIWQLGVIFESNSQVVKAIRYKYNFLMTSASIFPFSFSDKELRRYGQI